MFIGLRNINSKSDRLALRDRNSIIKELAQIRDWESSKLKNSNCHRRSKAITCIKITPIWTSSVNLKIKR